jgi:hypothetical protein
MHVLTVKQPWADCIVSGLKPVENRSRSTSYRGLLAIHASSTRRDMSEKAKHLAFPALAQRHAISDAHSGPLCPRPLHFVQGKIVGFVELYDCVSDDNLTSRWVATSEWYTGPFGWLLRNPRILVKPIDYVGHLSTRPATAELEARILNSVQE